MAPIRSTLKFFALSVFALAGWIKIRLTVRPTLIILTYHRVLPADHPDRSCEQPGMVIAPELLRNHIRYMKACGATPVHLDDWLSAQATPNKLPRLSFALTFDDGWRDNYQYAFPVLNEEQVPATIFLVTRLLDTNRTFWPEQVLKLIISQPLPPDAPEYQWLTPFLPDQQPDSAPLDLEQADDVVNRLKVLDDAVILAHLERMSALSASKPRKPLSRVILNSGELTEMASSGLIRFGAHTQHHYRLNRVAEPAALRREIVDSLTDLDPLGAEAVPIFCYPNGDITGRGEELVEQHYKAACTTRTGWNPVTRNPFDLRRFNLHDGNSFNNLRFLASLGRGIV